MKKILVGAIVGGIVAFLWSTIIHVVLPIGEAGIKVLPEEAAVVSAMRGAIYEPGLYFFPGMDMSHHPTPAEQEAWEAKYRSGPRGILVYHPEGAAPMAPGYLLTEVGSDLFAALIASFLLSHVVAGFGRRVLLTGALGLFAWLVMSVSHWNWYGFPGSFVMAEATDQVVGWLLAGLALAAIVKPAARSER